MTNSFSISFTVPGKPHGKGRPRFYSGHAITPHETHVYEQVVAWEAKAAGAKPQEGRCALQITAAFPCPASWSAKKRAAALRGEIPCMLTPDWDNIGKIISDALNGVAYFDDRQVERATVEKVYAATGFVNVTVIYL